MELFFFNTGISFSQGKFLLADCEVLACAHESWELVPLDELCLVGQRAEGIRGLQSCEGQPPFPFTLSPATLGGGKFWFCGVE